MDISTSKSALNVEILLNNFHTHSYLKGNIIFKKKLYFSSYSCSVIVFFFIERQSMLFSFDYIELIVNTAWMPPCWQGGRNIFFLTETLVLDCDKN